MSLKRKTILTLILIASLALLSTLSAAAQDATVKILYFYSPT